MYCGTQAPPGSRLIVLLSGVDTLDKERRGVEVFLRNRHLSVAGSLVEIVRTLRAGDTLDAHQPVGVVRSEAHRAGVRRPS
eukprot:5327785-Alexandrium_andersonii.AAC.1